MSQGQFYHRDSEICTFRPVENISVSLASLLLAPLSLTHFFSQHASARGACLLGVHEAFDSEFSHLRLASETISKCH